MEVMIRIAMASDFSWIYLVFFLIIPLARILPRLINKRRNRNSPQQPSQDQLRYYQTNNHSEKVIAKDQTETRLVLAELNRGSKTFEKIQKNTRLDAAELDGILEELETKGLLRVQQRPGIFGPKIELFPTEKGFSEYYS